MVKNWSIRLISVDFDRDLIFYEKEHPISASLYSMRSMVPLDEKIEKLQNIGF